MAKADVLIASAPYFVAPLFVLRPIVGGRICSDVTIALTWKIKHEVSGGNFVLLHAIDGRLG
jgi:hypothetical protein